MTRLFIAVVFYFAFLWSCLAQAPAENDQYYIYLVGDAGEPNVSSLPYVATIKSQLQKHPEVHSSFVFLGDNVYPRGLEDDDHALRKEGEQILSDQLAMADSKSKIFFVPGNHDWRRGTKDGLDQLLHQQAWIDSVNNSNIKLLPQDGCPGPVEVSLTEELTLVFMDTQWWLHPWEKPEGENSECDLKTKNDILAELEDILQRNLGKQVIIAAHHPIYTYGEHGGVFKAKDHLFPLTKLSKPLYLPLPVVGSIYPLYRKIFGNIQDIANPYYSEMRRSFLAILKQYPGTIYAAGHEHTLQYSLKDSLHFVVSGSGSKTNQVKKKGHARYAKAEFGFVRVALTSNKQVRIEYFAGAGQSPDFVQQFAVREKPTELDISTISARDSVTAKASDQYRAGRSRKRWMGANYRDVWSQDIKVPVFDFKSKEGDLKIVQRGGGMQTLSLRLEAPNGRQYTLRSIEKYPEKAIPEAFRESFAKEVVQDQISAAHPYGALVVPHLAEVAGIYHTNPKVVWLADDPRLGNYRKTLANRLMLFEERPSGKANGLDFFGNADEIESTFRVIKELAKDNDNYVDQEFVLRSRLFDLWIGDWDRHDDQWRWAEFDRKGGKMFRPIPRDRDQAFFVNEGRIPKLVSKKWAIPKLQGFDYELKWPSGFMFNARYFDRSFLTSLEKEDWIKEAKRLQSVLTDEVIEKAIKQWPVEIYDLHGPEIIDKLKARREHLVEDGLNHYYFLSKAVNVVGSNKHERFEVKFLENGDADVTVYKIQKEGDIEEKIFHRTFVKGETKEIRLYGLEGDDRFNFTGDTKKTIKVRVISGKGDDRFLSDAKAKPLVYAKPKGIKIRKESKFKDKRSPDKMVNQYNRKEFKYDLLAPLALLNYNVDDGLFVGGGFFATTHGFRKDPFKTRHLFLGSYAINTSSFNFKYNGKFTAVIKKWNAEMDLDVKSPNFVNNFFGLGNESVFDKKIDENPALNVDNAINYYRLRFKELNLNPTMSRSIGSNAFIKLGPSLQVVELERSAKDRFINDYETTLPVPILEQSRSFAGVSYSWGIDNRNNSLFTTRGMYLEQSSRLMKGFKGSANAFNSHTAAVSLYQTFRFPARVTYAFRALGGINSGNFEIYQSQILDGKTEVRGFRKTRFYGNRKLVFNNEVRLKLGNIRSFILPATIGLTGFYDIGRVWYKNELGVDPTAASGKSTVWHQGYGGGIWITPFNMAVISVEAAHSVEGTLGYFRLGFLF
ncbi:MAG TPA: BamA/TamA family outer membrane protein [Cyclobacteriaceae bacterium]